jgi:hypothetical protein
VGSLIFFVFLLSFSKMAFTNNTESTTDELAGIEKERSARGARTDPFPLLVVFTLGVVVGFVIARR